MRSGKVESGLARHYGYRNAYGCRFAEDGSGGPRVMWVAIWYAPSGCSFLPIRGAHLGATQPPASLNHNGDGYKEVNTSKVPHLVFGAFQLMYLSVIIEPEAEPPAASPLPMICLFTCVLSEPRHYQVAGISGTRCQRCCPLSSARRAVLLRTLLVFPTRAYKGLLRDCQCLYIMTVRINR